MNWLVPPVVLVGCTLRHAKMCGAKGGPSHTTVAISLFLANGLLQWNASGRVHSCMV